MNTVRKITEGRPFQCIRHPEQGSALPTDCIQYARRLCGECSTGAMVRRRAGISERPFNLHQEEDCVAKTIKVLDKCPGCGRENIKEKARGHCARCCNYLNKGKPIPPMEDHQVNERPVPGLTEAMLAEQPDDCDARPARPCLVLDMSGFPGADELAEWLHATAVDQLREPEAQAFYLLRQAQRIMALVRKDHKVCRCGQ